MGAWVNRGQGVRIVIVTALVLLLAACGSDALVREAYTAAGDGVAPKDVSKTAVFQHNDDLNVVVRLNAHARSLDLEAIFTAPDGSVFSTDTLKADATVGQVLLGLDWESRAGVSWVPGEWQMQLLVDGEAVETLRFTVKAAPVAPEPTPAS